MVSGDLPGGLISFADYAKKKKDEEIVRASRNRQTMMETLGAATELEAVYLRISEIEDRFSKLVEYVQDLYLTAKDLESDAASQNQRILFLVKAIKELADHTNFNQ